MTVFLGVLLTLCSHADRSPSPGRLPAVSVAVVFSVSPGLPGRPSPSPDPSREVAADEIEPSDDDETSAFVSSTGPGPLRASGELRFHPSPLLSPSPSPRTFSLRLRC